MTTPTAIAIVGSRHFADLALVRWTVAGLAEHQRGPLTLVSGHAVGVDRTAEDAARAWGLGVLSLPADWSKGRGAGMQRNTDIVNYSDAVIAFWDGHSHGTYDTITKAATAHKLARVYIEEPTQVRPKSVTVQTLGNEIAEQVLEWLDERNRQRILR